MLHRILGSALALAVASTAAVAADLPARAYPPVYTPPPVVPAFTWTGLYLGAQVGYDFGHTHGYGYAPGIGGIAAGGGDLDGVIGGAHVGYNYALPTANLFGALRGAQFVVGLEGDVDGSSATSNYALGGIAVSSNADIQGSVRGRLGIAVDRVLFYATGGAAFGGLSTTYMNTLNGLADTGNHTKVGYTVGGGVEYAIDNHWSIRAEYRHTDYGRVTDSLIASTNGGLGVRDHVTDDRVQAGFSYKFDMFSPVAAPVVARY